ncbi:MAG: hypothetical protein K8S55_10405 [Phycisphaerae bacterium]|nr:hypothetical protein [Phycisphaerae bacterium]
MSGAIEMAAGAVPLPAQPVQNNTSNVHRERSVESYKDAPVEDVSAERVQRVMMAENEATVVREEPPSDTPLTQIDILA